MFWPNKMVFEPAIIFSAECIQYYVILIKYYNLYT